MEIAIFPNGWPRGGRVDVEKVLRFTSILYGRLCTLPLTALPHTAYRVAPYRVGSTFTPPHPVRPGRHTICMDTPQPTYYGHYGHRDSFKWIDVHNQLSRMDGLRAKVAQSRGHAVDQVALLSTLPVGRAATCPRFCFSGRSG